jgi:hypothetical protein
MKNVIRRLLLLSPSPMEPEQEGLQMRELKPVICVMVAVIVMGCLADQVHALRPPIREVRDRVMWGDPDLPWARAHSPQEGLLGDLRGESRHSQIQPGFSVAVEPASLRLRLSLMAPMIEDPGEECLGSTRSARCARSDR